VGIIRAHLEEDAGKNLHDPEGGPSRVDLNRAGVPLMEIVSAPDIRSSDEAVEYLKNLRSILVYLGVNDGNLEEGSMRCDANVSVRKKGETGYRTRVEIKNLNSFRFLKQAIEYEVDRQIRTWEEGGQVEPETRQFDAQAGVTRAMRAKSEAEDYRYLDRKSTRLNSSHVKISYAVFCLKKKKTHVQFGARRARRIAAL